MKPSIIADSSGLISLISPLDSKNLEAIKIASRVEKTSSTIIIPSEILAEFINVLGKKMIHKEVAYIVTELFKTHGFRVIESTEAIRSQALQKFSKLPSSASYTDCLVMAFADHFETKIIFGFDEVFKKNGYQLPS